MNYRITDVELNDIEYLVKEMQKVFDDCQEQEEILRYKNANYMEKYYEYLGKDNDWRYLFRRSLHLLWLNIKINTLELTKYIPFRG